MRREYSNLYDLGYKIPFPPPPPLPRSWFEDEKVPNFKIEECYGFYALGVFVMITLISYYKHRAKNMQGNIEITIIENPAFRRKR